MKKEDSIKVLNSCLEILKVLQLCKNEQERIIIGNYKEEMNKFQQGMINAYRIIEFQIQGHCTELEQFEKEAEKIWRQKNEEKSDV